MRKAIQITQRDKDIIRAINRFGYTDVRYVSRYFEWNRTLAYRRLKKLAEHEFLIFNQFFHGKPGVYCATKIGAEMSRDHLPPIRKINLATYEHQLKVLDLSLKLTEQYGGKFISERDIRHQFGFAMAKDQRHIPDGVLDIEGQRIAIEVELSVKSQKRLEKIMRHYQKDFSYQAVWYFCGSFEVKNKIDKLSKQTDLVKTHLLEKT